MNIYDQLLKRLKEEAARHKSEADLMRRLDASKSTFYRALDEKDPKLPKSDELCRWLEKLRAQIVFPDEEMEDYVMIPKVKAVAGAGASLETNGDVSGMYAFRSDFLQREHISPKKAVMMMVRGDSMEDLIRDGDTILIDQTDNQPQDGRIFVVGFGDELMVKRLQKIPTGWNVCSENPKYGNFPVEGDDLENFRVYGRVRWFGRVI